MTYLRNEVGYFRESFCKHFNFSMSDFAYCFREFSLEDNKLFIAIRTEYSIKKAIRETKPLFRGSRSWYAELTRWFYSIHWVDKRKIEIRKSNILTSPDRYKEYKGVAEEFIEISFESKYI